MLKNHYLTLFLNKINSFFKLKFIFHVFINFIFTKLYKIKFTNFSLTYTLYWIIFYGMLWSFVFMLIFFFIYDTTFVTFWIKESIATWRSEFKGFVTKSGWGAKNFLIIGVMYLKYYDCSVAVGDFFLFTSTKIGYLTQNYTLLIESFNDLLFNNTVIYSFSANSSWSIYWLWEIVLIFFLIQVNNTNNLILLILSLLIFCHIMFSINHIYKDYLRNINIKLYIFFFYVFFYIFVRLFYFFISLNISWHLGYFTIFSIFSLLLISVYKNNLNIFFNYLWIIFFSFLIFYFCNHLFFVLNIFHIHLNLIINYCMWFGFIFKNKLFDLIVQYVTGVISFKFNLTLLSYFGLIVLNELIFWFITLLSYLQFIFLELFVKCIYS